MRALRSRPLQTMWQRWLDRWTMELVSEPDLQRRVELARRTWSSRSSTKTLRATRDVLREAGPGQERCTWCEDNRAEDIDHVRPKSVFPHRCYDFNNHVGACAGCNREKGDRAAVVSPDGGVRPLPAPVHSGQGYQLALIDPRSEEPSRWLTVDLETGILAARPRLEPTERARARYTIDALGLNQRRLPQARRVAVGNYRARLERYISTRDRGAPLAELEQHRVELTRLDHPTVWDEMRRQANHPLLEGVFERAPEALNWARVPAPGSADTAPSAAPRPGPLPR